MPDSEKAEASDKIESVFENTFSTLIKGVEKISPIVDRGAGHTLLTMGLAAAIFGAAARLMSGFFMLSGSQAEYFGSLDLAIMMLLAAFLLALGTSVKIWDRQLIEKEKDRQTRLYVDASDKAVLIADKAAAVLTSAVRTPPPVRGTAHKRERPV